MAYSGQSVKIPLGDLGMLTDFASSKAPPNSLIDARNVVYTRGLIEKAPGAILWNSTGQISPIVAAHYWEPTLVQSYMIAVTQYGDIYKQHVSDRTFNNPINATISSILTPNCVFTEGGAETAGREKKLFLFTGGATNPYVLSGDGTAFTSLATPSSDWTSTGTYPKFGLMHRGSLWAFAGQVSYASSTGNHEDFRNASAAFVDPVYPGEGGELRGAAVYKGRLIAFKDGGFVYMLNDTDADSANWYWQKIFSNFGLSAPNAVAEVLDNLYAGNTNGTITDYGATQALGGVEAVDLLQAAGIEQFIREIGQSGLSVQHFLYYSAKKWLLATYRNGYSTQNNMLLVLDFARKGVIRPSYWLKNEYSCLALYKDKNGVQRPMAGTIDGFLVLMDREDRNEQGYGGYTGAFQTQQLDFGQPEVQKHFDFLHVHYVPEGNYNLSCDYFIDGRYIETITFPMRQYLRPVLDTMTLDTDRLAQRNEETAICRISGSGRVFSARFYNSTAYHSFQVSAVTVQFRPGGHGAQKV